MSQSFCMVKQATLDDDSEFPLIVCHLFEVILDGRQHLFWLSGLLRIFEIPECLLLHSVACNFQV